jgi:hypothetical protein
MTDDHRCNGNVHRLGVTNDRNHCLSKGDYRNCAHQNLDAKMMDDLNRHLMDDLNRHLMDDPNQNGQRLLMTGDPKMDGLNRRKKIYWKNCGHLMDDPNLDGNQNCLMP